MSERLDSPDWRVRVFDRIAVKLVVALFLFATASAQQLTINRIEQMPNAPSPYLLRDWKQVARGYDSLVFDFNRTGTYLPLGRIVTNNINYPNHNSFGLHSYVGTNSPNGREAINCLPAVVGAALAGKRCLFRPAELLFSFGERRDIGWGRNWGRNERTIQICYAL